MPEKKNRNINSKTAAVRVIFFLAYFCFGSWMPFYNVYLQELGFSNTKVGQIAAVMPFCTVVFTLVWGFLADKYGRKRIIVIIMTCASLLLLGFLHKGDFWYYFMFTFLFAIFSTPLGSLVDSFGVSMVHDNSKISFGGFRVWASIGWALAAFLIGILIQDRDTRLIFIIASGVLMITWIIGLIGLEETTKASSSSDINLKNMFRLVKNKKLITFLLIIFFYALTSIPIFNMYNLYLKDMGASNKIIGLAFAIQSVCELPLFIFGDRIVRRFGVKRVMLVVISVTCIRLFIFSQSTIVLIPLLLSLVHGISFSLLIISSVEYVRQIVPAKWVATGQSLIWTFYMGAGMTAGSLWLGFLSDIFTMKKAVFIESIMSACLLVSTFVIFKFFKESKQNGKA